MTSWLRSPSVESSSRILDPVELLPEVLAHFLEAVEDDAFRLDRILYRFAEVLLGLRVGSSEDENLKVLRCHRHHSYSEYLKDLPLTRSAGYFCSFIAIFALAVSTGSMPSLSASSMR